MKYLVAVSLVLASFFSWAVTTSDFGSWSLLCNDSSVCTLSQLVAKDKEAKKEQTYKDTLHAKLEGKFKSAAHRKAVHAGKASGKRKK